MGLQKKLAGPLLMVCSSFSAQALTAELTGVDFRITNDSNPAKAEFESDIEASTSVLARVTANLYSRPLISSETVNSGLSVNASASLDHHTDIDGLGENRYRLSLDWFKESKSRYGSPFFRFGLGANYLDSQTEIRDSFLVDLSGSYNLQPTLFFDFTAGFQVELREAETEVFDTTKSTLFITSNFSPIPRFVLRTGIRLVVGDEVSTATPTLNIVNNANAIEPDEAFGGVPENRFAYLINATSTIAEIGFGYSISGSLQSNIMYRFVSTEADGDISYDRDLLEFSLSYDL